MLKSGCGDFDKAQLSQLNMPEGSGYKGEIM